MSPIIFSCVLCGYVVSDFRYPNCDSWMKHFRVIYSSPNGAYISGVGLYDDPRGGKWIAPSDYTARWNDAGYDFPGCDEIAVMKQSPRNGRHGFVIHEACWSLLERAYDPAPIPLIRLLEVCQSLPFPLRGTGVNWGHDYDGLVVLDTRNHYPWEDHLIGREEYSMVHRYARSNPYDVPGVQQLLQDTVQSPESPFSCDKFSPQTIIRRGVDCFDGLPWELREEIATHLSPADVVSLHLASGAFLDILQSKRFWASRFRADGERGFLFEVRESRVPRDWKLLYCFTKDANLTPELWNRKRIWSFIQPLMNILALQWNDSGHRGYSDQCGLKWRAVSGDLVQKTATGDWHLFRVGCRDIRTQSAFIPRRLSQLAVSTIRIGDLEYITGIRLISQEGEQVWLGYMAKGKELVLDVTTLKGFVVAVGSSGIHALQVITDNGDASRWFGCPEESPRTKRLVHLESAVALEAKFDGFKMVHLGVGENSSSHSKAQIENRSLRDFALWYPDIPPPGLCLNEDCFTGDNLLNEKYRPLFWSHFGGPGGIYLRNLIEISVLRLESLCFIEFRYNTHAIPATCRRLGRRKLTESSMVMRFPIDGPGGEVVETIEVGSEHFSSMHPNTFYKQEKRTSFKISTNRRRAFHFQPERDMQNENPLKQLMVAPGTTITGLYASQHPDMGLISFGVISEAVGSGRSPDSGE